MIAVQSRPCFLTPLKLNPNHPLFVFLPGMDGTGKLLRTQTAGLEAAFDVRCLAIPPDDLTSWEELTEQVVNLIQAELDSGSQRSVYLCGESFGGCLALKVALQAPALFNRIVLVNPASAFNRRPLIAWGSQFMPWLPGFFYQNSTATFLPFLAALERIAPEDRQVLLEATRSVPQKTSTWRLSLLREFEVSPQQLQSLSCPVLLIASQADRLLPSFLEARQLAHNLANAQIFTLPSSGHACLLEAEVNLYEIMRSSNFLTPDVITDAETASSEG